MSAVELIAEPEVGDGGEARADTMPITGERSNERSWIDPVRMEARM